MAKQTTEKKQQSRLMKLEVYVNTRKNHATNRDFKAFSVKMKDGKWHDLQFTKEVPQSILPTAHSLVFVREDKMNVDTSGKYLKVWVKEVEKIIQFERPLEDLAQYFEEVDENATDEDMKKEIEKEVVEEELPF